MPLGGATKKIQEILDTAEDLYNKVVELREDVMEMQETVQRTDQRVAVLENKLDQQAAILDALAAAEDVDVEAVVTEVAIEEAEPAGADEGNGGEVGAGAGEADIPSTDGDAD
jgi:DNA anti-recombination protein RmuC